MNIVLALLFCAALVEAVARLPAKELLRKYIAISNRAIATVRSRRISEHWKEKVLPAYAQQMFASSMRIGALLALVVLGAIGLAMLLNSLSASFSAFVISPLGGGVCAALCTLFWFARSRLVRD